MFRRILGLAFVVVLAGALSLSVLAYRKAFTPVTWVTLRADHTGMQLNDGAEVKLRGVPVGEVRQISADGGGATLRLALEPAGARQMPENVTARLLPKTLFGERYVALVPPAAPAKATLHSGSVIAQDRAETAIELERVLDGALPLLQAIKPDKLAATLGALAYALEGRGERLGADLVALDRYLAALNAQMPTIRDDVRRLADVLAVYDGALPDLLSILRDATVTATTISDQRTELAQFLADTTDLAEVTRAFLDRYDDRIIQLGQVSRPVLELLAAYSPEYPCLLHGVVALQPQVEQVFGSGAMHIAIEVTRDNGKYVPGRDEPVYGARNGPNCRGLPDPSVPAPGVAVNDGYDYGGTRPGPPKLSVGVPGGLPIAMGYAGTLEERGVLKPLLGAASGTPVDQVPDIAVLLWGPLLRGTVVNIS
jgi:phospholipid/cholesterol/gamma-HCH transport system substrate-binding protein